MSELEVVVYKTIRKLEKEIIKAEKDKQPYQKLVDNEIVQEDTLERIEFLDGYSTGLDNALGWLAHNNEVQKLLKYSKILDKQLKGKGN